MEGHRKSAEEPIIPEKKTITPEEKLWKIISELYSSEVVFLKKMGELDQEINIELGKTQSTSSHEKMVELQQALPLHNYILNQPGLSHEFLNKLENSTDIRKTLEDEFGGLSGALQFTIQFLNSRIGPDFYEMYTKQNIQRPRVEMLETELKLPFSITNNTILGTQRYPRYALFINEQLKALKDLKDDKYNEIVKDNAIEEELKVTNQNFEMFLKDSDKEADVVRYSQLLEDVNSADITLDEYFLNRNPLFALYHDLETYKDKKSDPTYRDCAKHFIHFIEQFKKGDVINIQDIDKIFAASQRYQHYVEKLLAKFHENPIEFEYELKQFENFYMNKDLKAQLLPPTSPLSPIISFLFYPSPPASPKGASSIKKEIQPEGKGKEKGKEGNVQSPPPSPSRSGKQG